MQILSRLFLVIPFVLLFLSDVLFSETGDVCNGEVGFRILQLYDNSRPSLSAPDESHVSGRFMQLSVWYPSNQKNSKQVSFGDLVALSATELNPKNSNDVSKKNAIDDFINEVMKRGVVNEKQLQSLMTRKTDAFWNAPSMDGKFPVIVFAHSTPPAEHLMAESLARCGFIVGAVNSKGTIERDYRLSIPDIETMVTDTMLVLAALRSLPGADQDRAGIIGMSNGAFAAVLAHLRNPQISTIVSLDGTIGEQAANRILPKDPYFDPAKIRASILHLYTTGNPYLTLEPIHSFVHSERTLVAMPGMRHYDFLAYGFYESIIPGFLGSPPTDHSSGFELVSRFTIQFFLAKLASVEDSRKFLESALMKNPAPDWIQSITSEKPE